MNEEATQAMEKIADRIIQKVTQDFTEKLWVVRSELSDKIEGVRSELSKKIEDKVEGVKTELLLKIEDKIEGVKAELTKKIEESSEKLNKKMDTGFGMMHTQINTVEENLTFRIQGIENRMESEAENRVTHYATKVEHEKLDKRVGVIEGTLKLA